MRRLHPFAPALRAATRSRMLKAGIALLALKAVAFGATFTFDADPLAGTIVRSVPGRQLVGGEQFISFNPAHDLFAFDPVIFGGGTQINFANGPVSALPSNANLLVLQTLDDDNDPLSPFGAFNAANLIASRVTDHGPGVFVFFNEDLSLPELIYSDDLASNQADLRVLARMIDAIGQVGINELPDFSTTNFSVTSPSSAAPEPSSDALISAAIGLLFIGNALRFSRSHSEETRLK